MSATRDPQHDRKMKKKREKKKEKKKKKEKEREKKKSDLLTDHFHRMQKRRGKKKTECHFLEGRVHAEEGDLDSVHQLASKWSISILQKEAGVYFPPKDRHQRGRR